MGLRDIRTAEMVAFARALQALKEKLVSYPLTEPFVAVVDETLEVLLAAQRVTEDSASEEELAQVRVLLKEHDAVFDNRVRVISRGLQLFALAFPDQAVECRTSHDVLFPEGISLVNSVWRNEAGEAELIRSRVESHPGTIELLKRSRLNDTSLYTYYEELVDAGRAMGPLAERLEVSATSTQTALTEFQARQRWLSMVMTLRRTIDLAGYSAEDREAVLGPIERLAIERGREKKEDEVVSTAPTTDDGGEAEAETRA